MTSADIKVQRQSDVRLGYLDKVLHAKVLLVLPEQLPGHLGRVQGVPVLGVDRQLEDLVPNLGRQSLDGSLGGALLSAQELLSVVLHRDRLPEPAQISKVEGKRLFPRLLERSDSLYDDSTPVLCLVAVCDADRDHLGWHARTGLLGPSHGRSSLLVLEVSQVLKRCPGDSVLERDHP